MVLPKQALYQAELHPETQKTRRFALVAQGWK